MKRVYVNEKWCLGCHLCEYNCAYANVGGINMYLSLKDKKISPNVRIEEKDNITYAVACRHCSDPICLKSCIAGAISQEDGVIKINKDKCVGCHTCILVCPYGVLHLTDNGVMQKCELCTNNGSKTPACVKGCPNNAIVFMEK